MTLKMIRATTSPVITVRQALFSTPNYTNSPKPHNHSRSEV